MKSMEPAYGGALGVNCSPAMGCGLWLSTLHQFSESLGVAIDARDPYTSRHSMEVAELSRLLSLWTGLSEKQAELVHIGGHLHDIGKIGVSDKVLNKPGRLTPEEWAEMKRHPEIGADILAPIREIAVKGIPEMVLHHHEAFSGRGYPHGLAGKAIPLGARIIAVADSLSAMLGQRSYRPAKAFDAALDELCRCAGEQFDPVIVETLLGHRDETRELFETPGFGARSLWEHPAGWRRNDERAFQR